MLSSYRIFVTEEQRALAQLQDDFQNLQLSLEVIQVNFKILLLAGRNKGALEILRLEKVEASLAGIENYKKQIISQIQTQTIVGGMEEINYFFKEAYDLQQGIKERLSRWIEDTSLEADMKKKLAVCNETIQKIEISPIVLPVQPHNQEAETSNLSRNTIL